MLNIGSDLVDSGLSTDNLREVLSVVFKNIIDIPLDEDIIKNVNNIENGDIGINFLKKNIEDCCCRIYDIYDGEADFTLAVRWMSEKNHFDLVYKHSTMNVSKTIFCKEGFNYFALLKNEDVKLYGITIPCKIAKVLGEVINFINDNIEIFNRVYMIKDGDFKDLLHIVSADGGSLSYLLNYTEGLNVKSYSNDQLLAGVEKLILDSEYKSNKVSLGKNKL